MVRFEFETDYVQLLYRDLVEGRVFKENDGVIQETKIKGCGKIVDFLLKYGEKVIGIEVKVWPESSHFEECLKYSPTLDAVFLAVPQEYVGLAKEYQEEKSEYRTIGIIGVSLNARSNIIEKASRFSPESNLKNAIIQKFFCDFHRKKEDEILRWIEVSKRYLKKIKQVHAEILEEFFKKGAFKYTYPLIALYIIARVYSPYKFLSWGKMVDKNYAEQKFYWKGKIPVWPELDSLETLGFIESYRYGTELPHLYYQLSDACYIQAQFMEKNVDDHARKIGLTSADTLVAKVQNKILNTQHEYEFNAFQS
nr:hypothetical protein [Candidatus Freyarchaeota archaeon]